MHPPSSTDRVTWHQRFRSFGLDLVIVLAIWLPGAVLESAEDPENPRDRGFYFMLTGLWYLLGLLAGTGGAWGGGQRWLVHAGVVGILLLATRILLAFARGIPLSVGRDLLVPVCAIVGGLIYRAAGFVRLRLAEQARHQRRPWLYRTYDGRQLEVYDPPRFAGRSRALKSLAGASLLLWLVLLVAPFFMDHPWTTSGRGGPEWFFMALSIVCWVWARKLCADSAQTILENSDSPFVLYLRSFLDDTDRGIIAPDGSRHETPEQLVVAAFDKLGSVVAVGHPDEGLPKLGARRLYVAGDHWQEVVADMMTRAQAVVLRVGRTPGLCWELAEAVRRTPPQGLVLFVPLQEGWTASRQDQYDEFRRWAGPFWEAPLPGEIKTSWMIYFDQSGRPSLLLPGNPAGLEGHPLAGPLSELSKEPLLRAQSAVTRRRMVRGIAIMGGLILIAVGLPFLWIMWLHLPADVLLVALVILFFVGVPVYAVVKVVTWLLRRKSSESNMP